MDIANAAEAERVRRQNAINGKTTKRTPKVFPFRKCFLAFLKSPFGFAGAYARWREKEF